MLKITDTPGYERLIDFRLTPFRGIIACFDTTSAESFANANNLMHDIGRYGGDCMFFVLAGTKSDLPSAMDPDAPNKFAEDFMTSYVGCSAKTGHGVNEVFKRVIEGIGWRQFKEDFVIEK